MKRRFSFFTRQDPPVEDEAPEFAAPRPDRPTYIVGDLHGCAALMERLLHLIDRDIGAIGAKEPQLVFLGDYVDRGLESAEVLARLRDLSADFPDNVVCLMGNHERMMLDFLDDPATRGPRWLRSGGWMTLASFGLPDPPEGLDATAEVYQAAAKALASAMPEGLAEWMAALPLSWRSGNLWAVHAAADPQHPMEDQSPRVLLWGHPEFGARARRDAAWVAHGHTVVDEPKLSDGIISVDTGAWQTGRLTACAIRPDGSNLFLTATA